MKRLLFLLPALALSAFLYAQPPTGPSPSPGLYEALEKIHGGWYRTHGNWYHENLLLVEKDSIFLYQSPLEIVNKKKIYSASDGAFYYYYGVTEKTDSGQIVHLTRHNCDYCAMPVQYDSAGFMHPISTTVTYKITLAAPGFTINHVHYHPSRTPANHFPPHNLFYFDSNSIYRVDPKGQYPLISTAIKNFLETKHLILDNDTLRVCIDRLVMDSLVETLDSGRIRLDSPGIILRFYSLAALKKIARTAKAPIRYIQPGKIIDYWKAARISLGYAIALPKTLHHFSERQYSILLQYNKVGSAYVPLSDGPDTSWQLVEQK